MLRTEYVEELQQIVRTSFYSNVDPAGLVWPGRSSVTIDSLRALTSKGPGAGVGRGDGVIHQEKNRKLWSNIVTILILFCIIEYPALAICC